MFRDNNASQPLILPSARAPQSSVMFIETEFQLIGLLKAFGFLNTQYL